MTNSQKPRWWMLYSLLTLAAIAEIVVWFRNSDDASQQVIATLMVVIVTVALILLWWIAFSRLPWKTRFAGLGALAVATALFFAVFRYEGMTGDFQPRFGLRFADTAEEQAAAFFETRQAAPKSTLAAGERLEIGPTDWPGFRGPNRDGRAVHEVVRTNWEEQAPRQVWRQKVGPAWSSFAAVGDLLFTQEQRGDQEAIVAYRAATGEEVWTHLNTARHETFLGGTGPRATPVLYDSRLYALGATGILDCLNPLTGELIWSRNIADDAGTQQLEFGFAGSPLITGDLVVVNPGKNVPEGGDKAMYDGTPPGAVIAYHRETGDIVWRTGQRQAGYTAPRIDTIAGEPQILIYSAWGLGGHDPQTGEELWWWEFINPYGTNSVQPIVTDDGGVFITTEQTGSALLDPRRNADGSWTVAARWERPNRFKLRFNGGVLKDNTVYGLDGGILAAFDLAEGERTWKKGRYRFGQILLLRDHLLVLAESGDVALLEISPEGMTEIARFHAIDGRCWNHPVVRDGFLYVRSDEEAAC
ncbi:MAG: PQQ-binding-like beta-propeller repeat protein, partial [Acidobacteriota bacterium]